MNQGLDSGSFRNNKFEMTEYDDILANAAGYDSDDSSGGDTDEELKEAFAAGLLKPGLNIIGEAPEKKVAKNNVSAMKQKLAELQKNLPWVLNHSLFLYDLIQLFVLDRTLRPGEYSCSSSSGNGLQRRSSRKGKIQ